MTVTLRTRITCPTCGCKIGYFAVATVRVNKRSMRTTGGGVILGALEDAFDWAAGKILRGEAAPAAAGTEPTDA